GDGRAGGGGLGLRHRQGGDDGQSEGGCGEMTQHGPAAAARVVHSIRSPGRVTEQPTSDSLLYRRWSALLAVDDSLVAAGRCALPGRIVGGAAYTCPAMRALP